MKNFQLLSIITSIFLFNSCSRILVKPSKDASPKMCFDKVWQTMNDKYVLFDYKNINWDSVKKVYEPQVNDNMTEQQLFDLLAKVIGTVRDGHTSLYAPIDTFRYLFYEGYAANFDSAFVEKKYWQANNFKESETIKYGVLNSNIGYMYYPSFSNELTQKALDSIFKSFSSTKGLIIDVRDNTGGDKDNIYRILEHIVTTETKMGSATEKKDATKNSFTEAIPISIAPKGISYLNKVVILTNRKVYSSANIFSAFASQIPNVKLIGDVTGGGSALPTSNDLPNGWRFRYSSSEVRLANGARFENGVLPSIAATTDSTIQALTGKDAIIERAILELQ
jgi:Peptidase family S41/Tricorn protease C1 domain